MSTLASIGSGSVGAIQALTLMLSAAFLSYVLLVLLPYARRPRAELGDPEDFRWHAFIPCRDEESVIGETISWHRDRFPGLELWVVDDASQDATAAIVTEFAKTDPMVHLIARQLPDARQGKGEALNAAYRRLLSELDDVDQDRVIVVVVDADGRLSEDALAAAAGPEALGRADVGGVQLEVRMANRDDARPRPDRGRMANATGRLLLRMQDIEFRSVIAAMQRSRNQLTRTAGLGGNGQFTRLSALRSIDEGDGRAWRGSLLEDFEIGLHLMLAGWRTAYSDGGYVDQEALADPRQYLTQRTRWGQGVMQCRRYLPAVWSSPQFSSLGAMELTYYLVQPWLALVGSLLFPVVAAVAVVGIGLTPGGAPGPLSPGAWGLLLVLALLGLGPFVIWGLLYRSRCEPQHRWIAGLGWGMAYLGYVYAFYLTSWRAAWRMLRGQHGWAKTRRNAERVPEGAGALDR